MTHWDVYHLSASGEDSNTCGNSTETACKTLGYVLDLYYGTNDVYGIGTGLHVMTSKSVSINESLMVSEMVKNLRYTLMPYGVKRFKYGLALSTIGQISHYLVPSTMRNFKFVSNILQFWADLTRTGSLQC